MEMIMGMVQTVSEAAAKVTDRVMTALVWGLEVEFGRGAGEALAHRFLKAEEGDFLWEARDRERWIGAYESVEAEDFDLDVVKILGFMNGKWVVATMIVDGDGNPHGVMGRRDFGCRQKALAAFVDG
jgi:uroporphyrinogen-III decarboxylase